MNRKDVNRQAWSRYSPSTRRALRFHYRQMRRTLGLCPDLAKCLIFLTTVALDTESWSRPVSHA